MNQYKVEAAGYVVTVNASSFSTATNRAVTQLERDKVIPKDTQRLEITVTLTRRDIQKDTGGQ